MKKKMKKKLFNPNTMDFPLNKNEISRYGIDYILDLHFKCAIE